MTNPMALERLAEIEQRFASGRVVNVVTQRALLAEVRRLQAAVERARELHKPISQQTITGDCAAGSCDHEDACPTVPLDVCSECHRVAEESYSYYGELGLDLCRMALPDHRRAGRRRAVRIYVSGPMSGYPEFNYPAFAAAADRLCTLGHEPVSPHTIGQHDGWTWDDYMEAAIKLQRDCHGIYMLPGWRDSRGATVEWYVAQALGQCVWGSPA